MKGYIHTSNYYISTITTDISSTGTSGKFDVSEITIDGVTLPDNGYYRLDVDFGDVSKREIFRIKRRVGYTLEYDNRISPYGMHSHDAGASVGLRDFAELLNSLASNTDNFGQVEVIDGLNIRVYGGKVNISGREVKTVSDKDFTLQPNKTLYVEYDSVLNDFDITELPTGVGYGIAKIITADAMVLSFEDERAPVVNIQWGDMEGGTYDPDEIKGDVFDMDNMKQGQNNLYITNEQRDDWTSKQPALVSGQNIATVNGHNLLTESDIVISAQYGFNWAHETSEKGISSYTLINTPIESTSFMVYTNGGIRLREIDDFTVSINEGQYTINLNQTLAPSESLYVDVMISDGRRIDPTTVGSGDIDFLINGRAVGRLNVNQTQSGEIDLGTVGDGILTISKGTSTLTEFSANATENANLALDEHIGEGSLKIKYGNQEVVNFSANDFNDKEINIEKSYLLTEAEYTALGDDKLINGNFYFIYS